MKILFNVKDSPTCSSAYGKIAYYLTDSIADRFQLVLLAPIGLEYGILNFGEAKVYGKLADTTGEDVALEIYRRERCSLYLTLPEVWWLPHSHEWAARGLVNWACWVPHDHLNTPRFWIERLSRALAVIPTYRASEEALRRSLDNVLPYVYLCGVETGLYAPLAETKQQVYERFPLTRRSIGGEADFIVSVVAMNSRRKNWEHLLRVLKLFQEDNPDLKIAAYLHAMPAVSAEYDLRLMVEEVGLRNVTFADPLQLSYGYSEEEMVRILNCSDVLLSLSCESGNLPAVEAMSCGTAPVVLDACVNSEIVPFEELKVKVGGEFLTPNPCLLKALPDLEDAVRALNHVLNGDQDSYMRRCREWALRFDWENIAAQLIERLERIEELIGERCLEPPTLPKEAEAFCM